MDIGGWLRGLGLGQYEAMFRESEIDAEVLPDLTEHDLGQLGVPLGHRKRLLKAIAALGAAEKALESPPAAPREDALSVGGERRQPVGLLGRKLREDRYRGQPVGVHSLILS